VTDVIEVHTTLPSQEQANDLARRLVEARLAACVQVIGPIESTYRWEGKVEQAQEWLLLIKTTTSAYEAMELSLREWHPYEVPEIIALAVHAGSRGYLEWVSGQLSNGR
jgi:periplasmic divalent cation tolerance protein